MHTTWLDCKLEKIRVNPTTANRVLRRTFRFCSGQAVPYGGSSHGDFKKSRPASFQSNTRSGSSRIPVGKAGIGGENGSVWPSPHEAFAKSCETRAKIWALIADQSARQSGSYRRPPVVEKFATSTPRHSFSGTGSEFGNPDGCINIGLGVRISRKTLPRDLVPGREEAAHKCAGNENGSSSLPEIEENFPEKPDLVLHRQLDNSFLCEQAGGHALETYDVRDKGRVQSLSRLAVQGPSVSLSRAFKCASGPRIPSGTSPEYRMAVRRRRYAVDQRTFSVGSTFGGRVCKPVKPAMRKLHLTMSGSSSPRDRCPSLPLAGLSPIRFPAKCNSATSSGEIADDSIEEVIVTRTVSAVSGLVLDISSDVDPFSPIDPDDEGSAFTTALGSPASTTITAEPTLVDNKNAWIKKRGFSQRVVDQMTQARCKSTNAVYKSRWSIFENFCRAGNQEPHTASPALVAEFLTHCFDVRKSNARTLQGYRSAIAANLKLSSGYDPGMDPILSQLIKSFFRARPVKDNTVIQWDLSVVLRYLKFGALGPTGLLSLRDLTLKTVFLLTLASGKRRGEIHALDNNVFKVQGNWDSIVLRPRADFLGKTHFTTNGAGTFSEIILPALTKADGATLQDISLCPVKTLRVYRAKTEKIRTEAQKRLIISYARSKVTDISKRCISNYLRWIVEQAYTDLAGNGELCKAMKMKPHDIRGIAMTLKSCSQVSMHEILAAGVWSSMSTFLKFYVKDFCHNETSELYSLGPFVAAESVIS